MAKTKKRIFNPEFRAKAVGLCRLGTRSINQVARDLKISESAMRCWVRQAEIDDGKGPSEALTSSEREELRKLKKDNRELRQERDILKAAAIFFAKGSE